MNENEKNNKTLDNQTESDQNIPAQLPKSQEEIILLSEFFDNASTILNQLKTMTLATILFKDEQSLNLTSKYEKDMLKNYKKRIELYISCLFDYQFDIFTPPVKGYFEDFDISLFFEFYEPQFKIIANIDSGLSVIDIGYDLNALPILECLETGIMSRELFCMLEKMNFHNYDNGILISKCTDFRLKPNKNFLVKITVGSELINHISSILNPSNDQIKKLEFEKQALLLQNPKLCTDPSPDVARIYSDIDWREKMWKNHENATKRTMTRKNLPPKPKYSKFTTIDHNHRPDIEPYQKQLDLLFQNYQV